MSEQEANHPNKKRRIDFPIPSFEFSTATKIVFGRGVLKQSADLIFPFGTNVFIVTGKDVTRAKSFVSTHLSPKNPNLKTSFFSVEDEPSVEIIEQGIQECKNLNANVIVAFGGGSSIDAGKAIAALVTNGGQVLDYLEVVGRGQILKQPSLPLIAIPTTAGTGAEVTKNAVVCSLQHNQKASLRSNFMLPNVALVDPDLTISVPKSVTAATGLDAFTQCLESFVSNKSNPITDALCREGIYRAARSIRKVYDNGSDIQAREDMCVTSLFGGMALANSKLGAVHGFAGPLGGQFRKASHGAVCAAVLARTIEINVKALMERESNSPYLSKFDEIGQILTGNSNANAQDAVRWIRETCQHLNIPGLSSYGVQKSDIASIVEKAAKSSSMQGNPIKLTVAELTDILEHSF